MPLVPVDDVADDVMYGATASVRFTGNRDREHGVEVAQLGL